MRSSRYGRILGVPEKILEKAPSDGLGDQTDEEKMKVTYKQIEEVIETGNTEDETAKSKILQMHERSEHKRTLPPIYGFEREKIWEN